MGLVDLIKEMKVDITKGKLCYITSRKAIHKKEILKRYPCGKIVPYDETNRCKKTHQCGAYLAFTRDGIINYDALCIRYAYP